MIFVCLVALVAVAHAGSEGAEGDFPILDCPKGPQPVHLPESLPAPLLNALKAADAAVSAWLQMYNLPGASVGVIYNQKVLMSKGYGVANYETKLPPTGDSIYRIGSVSKVFASLSLMQMRDAGLVDLDEQVADKFPFVTINDIWRTKRSITYKMLGSHMSGLPRSSPCDSFFGVCNITTAEVFQRLVGESSVEPIEELPSYSNFASALLGQLMGDLAMNEGYASYEDFVQQSILNPLDMDSTGFQYTPDVVAKMATGYIDGTQVPAPLFDLGWESPAGQMYSSVNDLLKLAALMFREDKAVNATSNQILDGATIREWLLPVFVTGASGSSGNGQLFMQGMPWECYLTPNSGAMGRYWTKGKDGAFVGYGSGFYLVPDLHFGVVVLMNGGVGSPATQVAMNITGIILPVLEQVLMGLQPAYPLPPNPAVYANTSLWGNSSLPLPTVITGISGTISRVAGTNQYQLYFVFKFSPEVGGFSFPAVNDNTLVFNAVRSTATQHWFQMTTAMGGCDTGGGNQFVVASLNTNGTLISLTVPGLWYGVTLYPLS